MEITLYCVHLKSLSDPCPDCEGKAEDGGWDGSGLRLVDPQCIGESPWKTLSRERWDDEYGKGDFDRRLGDAAAQREP